jgi:transposase InsO family protein
VAAGALPPVLGTPVADKPAGSGRPGTAVEIRRLIERMVAANPLWRAPRVHGELQMLGVPISERAVARILRRLQRPPNQTWKTFLHNHLGQMVSIDFFTVPTITLRVMFVFVALEHRRRQVLHFNVTEHPTAAWTAQQIVEAFVDRDAPRYLIRDRDRVYDDEVRHRIASLGIEEVLTAPQCPWQNPYAERLVGSIRRDCLDHFIILNARHLKRTLASYFRYYHESRTHLGLGKQCPFPRQVSKARKDRGDPATRWASSPL